MDGASSSTFCLGGQMSTFSTTGFKMTQFKSPMDALHTLFNMSIGDTGTWEEMRAIHGWWGVLYQYTFFVFMGFIMINIFLAIIMDSYAEVVGEARSQGAHTIMQDMRKAQAVFATSGKNPYIIRRANIQTPR